MAYIPNDLLAEARKMDLLTYLMNYQPERLKKISHDTYSIKDHDSLLISNGLWHYQLCGIGGRSAMDFLHEVDGYKLTVAAQIILDKMKISPPKYVKYSQKEADNRLRLPEKSNSNQRIINYLLGHGIDYHIIMDCIDKSLIYQSVYKKTGTKQIYPNATFLGYDRTSHLPKYANVRGINGNFKGDAPA